jgi:hypothetical protein
MNKDCLLTMVEGSEAFAHVARQVLQKALAFDVLACVCIVCELSDRALARSEVLVIGGGEGGGNAAAAACSGLGARGVFEERSLAVVLLLLK